MAVAGSTKEGFMLRIDNGRLVIVGKHRMAGHLIESSVDRAADKLLRGETVFLEAYGMNLPKIQERFKNVTESSINTPAQR